MSEWSPRGGVIFVGAIALIGLAVAALLGCESGLTVTDVPGSPYLEIVKVRGCEYVRFAHTGFRIGGIAHAGDCDNPIHSRKEVPTDGATE